jgi:hypothetical protein
VTEPVNAAEEQEKTRRLSAFEQWKRDNHTPETPRAPRAFAAPKPDWWPEWFFGKWV